VIYGTSIDETKEIAEKYTNNVFWDHDLGLGAARNLGMRKAKSEIVAMIDSDVILTKSWYQQLITLFSDPKVAAVTGTCIYGYGCKPIENLWEYTRRNSDQNWGCHNSMFRRKTILEIGNFDEKIRGAGEDYDLYLRLLRAGYRWVWNKNVTVYHPITIPDYLEHTYWWASGLYQFRESKFRLRDFIKAIPGIIVRSGHYSFHAHPTLALLFPLFCFSSLAAEFKASLGKP
jgi:GT2 family glycosyltransferase